MSDDASLEKSGATASACMLRKGLLWQQRDKIFSRWKERFFVLTPDYLNCFKRGTSRMSEMGEFLFKVRWALISSSLTFMPPQWLRLWCRCPVLNQG